MRLGRAATLVSAVGVLVVGLVSVSCTGRDITQTTQVQLIVSKIEAVRGQSGAAGGTPSAFLISDVGPVRYNDNAVLTVDCVPVNPTVMDTDQRALGTYDSVQLLQYDVRFIRTDGHNVEGVDVPYGFSGPLGILVPFNGEAETSFVIVRHEAKTEPPLRQLLYIGNEVGSGGDRMIVAIAEITIHGKTLGGDVVSAQTQLEIHFGDFADN